MILTPRSLNNIWSDVRHKRFRVRDVETLEDYFVVNIKCWMQGIPHYLEMVKCDETMFVHYSMDGWSQRWALLSTREEIELLNSLQEQQAKFRAKSPYRKLR
jgi:hypothetical protein